MEAGQAQHFLDVLATEHLASCTVPPVSGARLQQLGWEVGKTPRSHNKYYSWPGSERWIRCCPKVVQQLEELDDGTYEAVLGGVGVLPKQVRSWCQSYLEVCENLTGCLCL